MKFYTLVEAVDRMNFHGSHRKPFFFAIDYEMTKALVLCNEELCTPEVLYDIDGKRNYTLTECTSSPGVTIVKKIPVDYTRYREAFEFVQRNVRDGNSYLVNLTFPTRVEIDCSLRDLFFRGWARFKLWIDDLCTVFSPERFVRIEKGTISTYPMKGTIDATITNAETMILCDEKEAAEHATVVDLLRNDLSMVAKDVRVVRYRYVERLHTNQKDLLQVSSHISGILNYEYHRKIGTILTTLLPAGSICGAPKRKTIEIIQQAEQQPRGFYTGVFGYFDGENLDSAVMIRYFEYSNGQYYFRSGGGITVYSDGEREYQELIDKVYVPLP
ncbi:MAG: aminodeoxychorismate synthase component I [Bacteroidetes bacterium]|nr:aminodeoxychorismate synthase component I [Bacteroidota bacterium]